LTRKNHPHVYGMRTRDTRRSFVTVEQTARLEIQTRNCALCGLLCAEYDDADPRIPRAVRAVMPHILAGARICQPCDKAQHAPRTIAPDAVLTSLEPVARAGR